VDRAFSVAWAKLSGAVRDPKKAKAVQGVLRFKVCHIAKAGVVDPHVMSALALAQMPPLNAAFEKTRRGSK